MDAPNDKRIRGAGSLFFVWLTVFAVVFAALSISTARMGRLQWKVESGRPIPEDFSYVYYPRDADATVYEESRDEPIGDIDRAMVVTQRELEAGERNIEYEDGIGRVRIVDLRAAPDDQRGEAQLNRWREFVRQRNEPSWFTDVEIEYEVEDDGPTGYQRAVFRGIRAGGVTDVFTYATDGEYTEALRWVRRTGEGSALNVAANVLSAAVLATVAMLGVVAARAMRRRTA